ncbi:MAG: glutamine--fructose-6-phosphate transaminase (isomerizing) [Halothiobacillus sp. 24-54-40]|jgi:glucosamine--fructose-6-phosphate aminotransferase (isomerizing)|nr:MAG: glutamine--fructose-6-phosphate transaminase (isomerizing) [Halothiobacillus sp. 35-54-62]OYZ87850.1 MAG: glutamine--fructose-6-phosphate transaminase (isomerizing) [Halothiobacillus sp. 24-54-40]OZA80660.1 MAG: glutamine--fructose-6-phosphate transaminase (isomerizing) [Halothiobacillus sp. 39-53-45]HQS01703.1 glutamine--fructose-6-phosphate transaminase (isomerizing) [Halothiobacillus sp.]HQS28279.1 glutamine--fructose-6-phosphate transaminase (isomerizing) [Halothiobacillus sp.]
MCGIVAAIGQRPVWPILMEGLRRLEYRGYDSAGMAVLNAQGQIAASRAVGKVQALADQISAQNLQSNDFQGCSGIAHTRWATHGVPAERNAHPHMAGGRVAVVHNGIIENHASLRIELQQAGRVFLSDTDTEVIAHLFDQNLAAGLAPEPAFYATLNRLHGAFALAILVTDAPDQLFVARQGSPLVIGVGIGELFAASDALALLPVTQRFVYLAEGDRAVLTRDAFTVVDALGQAVTRLIVESTQRADSADRGGYKHFMLKEIHEQPRAIADTLEGRISDGRVLPAAFGVGAEAVLRDVQRLQIVACGTSYHAGMVARYWFEDILGLPAAVEVSSEFHYRNPVLEAGTLLVMLSQSGETADTLAALRMVRQRMPSMPILAICNAPESSLVREADLVLMTHAGPEISVASTKAFSTQLVSLALLLLAIGRLQGRLNEGDERRIVAGLEKIPQLAQNALTHDAEILALAERLVDKQHALFLGRGVMYPIALEGALKLKEISYIHAEGYPAGELKHGPLALIDEQMPVITIAPQNDLLDKLKSNMSEVAARGAELFVFADERAGIEPEPRLHVLPVTSHVGRISAPIIFNIPLQLLAYHVAVLKGTDVDQPRNLAKSVTVE